MAKFKPGDNLILKRKPFLHKGVIVVGNAKVTVLEAEESGSSYSVRYMDRENQPHTLTGIPETDLEAT